MRKMDKRGILFQEISVVLAIKPTELEIVQFRILYIISLFKKWERIMIKMKQIAITFLQIKKIMKKMKMTILLFIS